MKLTVRELVAFGRFPYSGGRLTQEDNEIIDRAIAYMELGDFEEQFIDELSGGQRQRAYIAMVIAQDTEYILLDEPTMIMADEPTGALDSKSARQLHEQGTTIIVVTHDALVASCAQREIMLNHGVLVGEQWNDEEARRAYEAAGGEPAHTGSDAEGAQNGGVAISFVDPTKAAKTGDTDADADGTEGERA